MSVVARGHFNFVAIRQANFERLERLHGDALPNLILRHVFFLPSHGWFVNPQRPYPDRFASTIDVLQILLAIPAHFVIFNHESLNRIIYVGSVLLFSALWGHAEVILVDTFDYPNGPLTNVSDGIWSATDPNVDRVDVASGRAYLLGGSKREDVHANLLIRANTNAPASGVVLYASLTINFTNPPSGSGDYFAHFRGNGNTFRCLIYATTSGVPSGFFRVGVANSTGANGKPSSVLPVNLEVNTNYTLVARYDVNNATSTVWIDPISESDPSA
ncbi:MAG TPA: hypothetical protein VGK40_06095, partial [Verrucomicrobiae bacterium]